MQHLRYKYINFLDSAIEKATNNQLDLAKSEEVDLVKEMESENQQINSEYLISLVKDMESKTDN